MTDRAAKVAHALRRVPPGRAKDWLRRLLLHGDAGRAAPRRRQPRAVEHVSKT